ncbi:MAG: oligosaccharide flippase family protein [Gemmatimonadota bacterium]|nr:oligosaccharide flippase family protein [Gemmatimonadota bacterium]
MRDTTRLRVPTTYAPPLAPPVCAPGRRPSGALRRDMFANLLGRGWVALAGLLFVPLYIKLLGVEAYGLVGFTAALQVGISLLDVGLATTLNRELARIRASGGRPAGGGANDSAQQQRDLVRTLESTYWIAALVIVALVELAASGIAKEWLHPERLSTGSVENAIRLIGITIALQFPFTLYEGGLLGIGRQVALNVLIVVGATLRFGAVVAVLVWVSATIEAFFIWQVAVTALQTLVAGWLLWSSLPKARFRARFRRDVLSGVSGFATGMAGISLSAVVLSQMDKVVLSKVLTLSAFGYYTLAAAAAGVLYVLFLPLFQAVFPRFSQLYAIGDVRALAALYHRSAQALAVLILPAATVLALFSHEIILLWTQNQDAADATRALVALFAIGTALQGLMNVPYALQLAAGWTTLALYANLVAIGVLLPGLVVLASRYGALGAGFIWVALNVGYATIGVAIMHRRLLRGHLGRWYGADVGLPLLASIAAAGTVRLAVPAPTGAPALFAVLAAALTLTYLAAAMATPVGRDVLRRRTGPAEVLGRALATAPPRDPSPAGRRDGS